MFRRDMKRPNTKIIKTPPKESISVEGGNGITKFWTHMPKNYTELLLFINVNSYYRVTSPALQKLIVYNTKTSTSTIFTQYNLINYEMLPASTFSDDLSYIKKRYTLIHIFDLFLKIVENTKLPQININNIFDKYFVTAQAMTKNIIRKKLNNKGIILMHLSETSMTNDVYFILALQTILKLEYIKECTEIDTQDPDVMRKCSNISNISDECMILVYSDHHPNNSLYVKQFIHKISAVVPFFKSNIIDANKCIEELINNNKTKPEIPRNILYNLSSYVIIDTDEHVMFSMAAMMNNTATIIFAKKFIRASIAEIIRLKIREIDYKKCRTLEEIDDKRFVSL
jgi:hypothetical protein